MKTQPEEPDCCEFYTAIAVEVLKQCAVDCNLSISSVNEDIIRLRTRVEGEGINFLTKVLPSLGKRLDKALGSGFDFFEGWDVPLALSKKPPYTPRFLGAFWKLIFSSSKVVVSDDGQPRLLFMNMEEPTEDQIRAVRAVRQVCYLFYKLEGSHSSQSEVDCIDGFVETDTSLPEREEEIPLSPGTLRAMEIARIVLARLLRSLDLGEIIPRHGPGAVATGEKPWEKIHFSRFYADADEVYPYSDYFFYNYSHLCDDLSRLEELSEDESPAKVSLVPKDSRGPRLISMEPLELQWLQQGILVELVKHIERHCPSSGYVNFTDQSINRELALESSKSQEWDTLDMKDASDRVSCWLVDQLFPPHVKKYIFATRSKVTQLPTGQLLRLRKFAPMGSAVCFPVEALTFWSLALGALYVNSGSRSFSFQEGLLQPVYIYGDDLIVPHGTLEAIQPVFEELYLRFSSDKCCTHGFFRESCGMDAYYGSCVTPVRVKTRWASELSPTAYLSWVNLVNRFTMTGFVNVASMITGELDKQRFGPVPLTNKPVGWNLPATVVMSDWDSSSVVAHLLYTHKSRYNRRLQRVEISVLQPAIQIRISGEPDWFEMLRLASGKRASRPFSVLKLSESLEPCRYPVPHRVKMRRRWVALHELHT